MGGKRATAGGDFQTATATWLEKSSARSPPRVDTNTALPPPREQLNCWRCGQAGNSVGDAR
ncbi:MAG: hypothetical protein ABGY24_03990, partial [bacterium]